MRDDCGESEDDECTDKNESLTPTNKTIRNRFNVNANNVDSKADRTLRDSATGKKELHSSDNDDCEIILCKKGKSKSEVGEGRDHQEPVRRSSSRLQGKKPKFTEASTTSDEEDSLASDDEDDARKKKRWKKSSLTRNNKRSRLTPVDSTDSKSLSQTSVRERKSKNNNPASKIPQEFSPGSFVVLKSDFHSMTTPPIWRIDGKALLQKYVHFEQEGQTLYKNTCTYSGWMSSNQDQYYPAQIEIKYLTRKETIVKFNKEKIIAD